MRGIKVLAFDTGGTVLDWHGGLVAVLAECGARRGIERDWHDFANEYRRRSLKRMLGTVEPSYNIDEVHRDVLDELLGEAAIDAFSPEDRRAVAQRWHELAVWPDFVPALTRLQPRYVCVSFTSSACPWSSMSRGATG
jgi:2-haloacid dehalogenase